MVWGGHVETRRERASPFAGALLGAALAAMCERRRAGAVHADRRSTERKSDPEIDKRTVRSGLVVALMLGWGVAGASGYPNDSNQIGDPTYYASSDVMVATGSGLFIGGALADYVNFGFFFVGQNYKSHDWSSKGAGVGFRVETFPLVYAVPTLKNLGLFAQFGIGSATLDVDAGTTPRRTGCSRSSASAGCTRSPSSTSSAATASSVRPSSTTRSTPRPSPAEPGSSASA